MTKFSGLETLKAAVLDAGVEVLTYVPGYPITEAAESLNGIQMAANEKVALEVALGASVTGRRSLVLVKHLGANLFSDPLSIAPTHTIGAGLVILVAEDVGPRGSQVELDIRHYGSLCEVPVLDPPDSESLGFALFEAYDLSEKISAPVIVRSTFDLAEDFGLGEDFDPAEEIVGVYKKCKEQGTGVMKYKGKMIDMPVVIRAMRILEMSKALKNKGEHK